MSTTEIRAANAATDPNSQCDPAETYQAQRRHSNAARQMSVVQLRDFARRTALPAAECAAPTAPLSPESQRMVDLSHQQEREREQRIAVSRALARHSLSVVLPAFNEEQSIRAILAEVVSALNSWGADYEVIVVNDGSHDHTGEVLAAFAAHDARVRLVTHHTNRGYGAALTSGFAAAVNDLTFFMDSDGQFTITDLPRLLVQIESVDAALGYRLHRQDSWLRSLNALGWKALVSLALGVRVRDLDCAYKLFRTDFLHTYPPTTGGALINAELLYTLHRTGATYREVAVRHLPRNGGRATGASPRVILRALHDLISYTWRQRLRAALRTVTPATAKESHP